MKDKKKFIKPIETKTPTDGLKIDIIKINNDSKKVKATDVFGKIYKSKKN
tara:strand:- start:748 stop:897 length:150 start_codon:yes stop_codon:yes gene_type:complete